MCKSFERWAAADRFEQMRDWLRAQWRERLGRHAQLTAAVLDSQTTRHSSQGGEAGFDAGKKIRGRKRHLLVDTRGLLLAVTVTGHMGCACSGVRRARHCVVKCVLGVLWTRYEQRRLTLPWGQASKSRLLDDRH